MADLLATPNTSAEGQTLLTAGTTTAEPQERRTAPQARRDLLTLAQVLAELAVPKSTFFRWKATGKAPRTIKYPNGSLRVRRTDLDTWIKNHEEIGVVA